MGEKWELYCSCILIECLVTGSVAESPLEKAVCCETPVKLRSSHFGPSRRNFETKVAEGVGSVAYKARSLVGVVRA